MEKKTENRRPEETKNPYHITETQLNSCSVTDCTGAVPAAPYSESEQESYLEVYQYEPLSFPARGKFTGAMNCASEGVKRLEGISDEPERKQKG